jgi:hypothetical protein
MVALKPENIFSTSKSNMYINTLSDNKEFDYNKSAFFITERIKLAYRLGEIDDELLEENEDATLALLDRILSAMQGKNITVPRQIVTFEANGLLHFKKEILDLPGEYFGTYKGRTDYRIVLTKYNFVVALEEEYDDVYYLKIDDCFEALKEYETYGKVQSEAHWKRLGANYG